MTLRLIHINSAPKWNGEAAHSVELCRGLADRGHEVLWIGNRESIALEKARDAGLETMGLRLKSRFGAWRELEDAWALRRAIKKRRPHIVHCHRGKDHLIALIAMRWMGMRLPSLLARTRHVVMPIRQKSGNSYIFEKTTDMIMAVSRATAGSLGPYWPGGDAGIQRAWELFAGQMLVDSQKEIDLTSITSTSGPYEKKRVGAIILSSADHQIFNPGRRDLAWREKECGVPPEAVAVGLVGRMQRIKGQHVYLEACELLAESHPDVHFISAGRGNEERLGKLAEKGANGPLGDRWHVLGEMEDIAKVIAALDVGVVASLGSEGSSRIMYEYLSSGLPTVATRVGGIPEMPEAYKGLDLELVESKNPQELAQAMERQISKVREGRPQKYPEELLRLIGRERWLDNIEQLYMALAASNAGRLKSLER